MSPSRAFLAELYRTAVAAAHPATCLVPHLPDPPPRGRLIILAAGKAAGAMAEVAEAHYLGRMAAARILGLAVTRRGYARPTRVVEVMEAGHPVPDAASLAGAERALALATEATADDLVLVLMSGGASANWIAPAAGLTVAEKQAVNRALLKSGAGIGDINTVRKHLSRIKGGRLARCARPAPVVTLAISDVPGDDPAVIGSGPTVPDPTTLAAAHGRLARTLLTEGRRAVVVSGGELTVTLAGSGRGGPNQEYALALAQALDGTPGIAAIAGDTDGTDGGGGSPDDPAGAYVDETTLARARQLGLDPAAFLADNDSTGFFERLGDLLKPGPTYTNVNDFRAILVDRL
jgi:glycerate-2-kinase